MVKRYNCTNGGARYCYGCYTMEADDEYGEWVKAEDYDALAARLAEAERLLAAWHRAYHAGAGKEGIDDDTTTWLAGITVSADAARYEAHVEMEKQAREAGK